MLMAVFDGHGQHGEHCSEYAAFECIELLESHPTALKQNPRDALFTQIVEADSRLRKKRDVPSYESGTTAIVCILRPDRIWAACVGDSRATIEYGSWLAIDLSVDQKPDQPKERERIVESGGFVSEASDAYGPARVWRYSYGLGPGLAMARSIGDHAVAELGVFAEPEITETEVRPEDRCILLASDGVWEFMSSQEAISLVQRFSNDASAACKALIMEAAWRWKKEEGNYRDDITAIVCFLPAIDKSAASDTKDTKSKAEFDGDIAGQEAQNENASEAQPNAAASSNAPVSSNASTKDDSNDFVRRRLSVAPPAPKR
ncbi:MAG: hypothetical protein SGPRY_001625 [Prymnesium sp.]